MAYTGLNYAAEQGQSRTLAGNAEGGGGKIRDSAVFKTLKKKALYRAEANTRRLHPVLMQELLLAAHRPLPFIGLRFS